jgi:hypothetical protein
MDTCNVRDNEDTASPIKCQVEPYRFNADQIYKFLSVMTATVFLYASLIMAVITA